MYTPFSSPKYPRAPITEAVIELRIATGLETVIIDKIAKRLKKRYDTQAPLQQVNLILDMTGSGTTAVQQQNNGHRFATYDQADIALLTPVNLTTARLAPYPGWHAFQTMARENWADWCSIAPRHPISRVGVRYINRIDIPLPDDGIVQLETYLTTHPRSEILERPLTGFMVQAQFDAFLPKWVATLTTAPLTPHPVPNHFSLLLDIDVSRTQDIPEKSDEMWTMINEAQTIKNDLFERALTPATKEFFRE